MSEEGIIFDKFINGKFFQMTPKDAKRVATRIFQIYDKDASGNINFRESKFILRNIYKNFKNKKKLSDEDFKEYFELLNHKSGKNKIYQEDFEKMVEKYYVTFDKNGSFDKQVVSPELYELDLDKVQSENNKVFNDKLVKDQLIKECEKRFGESFTKQQLKFSKELFAQYSSLGPEQASYEDMVKMFQEIFRKIGYLKKSESIDKDDVENLIKLIDYQKQGSISIQEFELYYLKSILGS